MFIIFQLLSLKTGNTAAFCRIAQPKRNNNITTLLLQYDEVSIRLCRNHIMLLKQIVLYLQLK